MQRTKVLVNLSLIEVSPLVDIEALNHGCKVITTINSYSHLVPDKNTFIVDPTNKPEIRETLKQFDSYLAENLDYDKGDQQDIDFERMFRVLEVE